MTPLQKTLGLKYPLIVAPMAGGPSSVDLVSAASKAGALGSIGGAYMNAEALEKFLFEVRVKTQKPIGLNLFVPSSQSKVSPSQIHQALERTNQFRGELGLPPMTTLEAPYEEDFDKQIEVVLRHQPEVLSFVFGLLDRSLVAELKRQKIRVVGTATQVDEALALQEIGVDAIVVQGVEAGGHRGLFDANADDPQIGLRPLLAEVRAKTKLPLIAAGGLMTADDVKSALAEGAEAVQMGTAFLATSEAGTSAAYRVQLLETEERKTQLTRVFSGRLARGIVNRFMTEMESAAGDVLPFPLQNKLTRDLRTASARKNSPDFLSLWAGTGRGKLWTGSAAQLIHALFE